MSFFNSARVAEVSTILTVHVGNREQLVLDVVPPPPQLAGAIFDILLPEHVYYNLNVFSAVPADRKHQKQRGIFLRL